MEDNTYLKQMEIKCAKLLPALPLWIIEYAWSRRLRGILNVLGPPLWLEGDWRSLTLVEPCSVRAAAAEAWAILTARDVEHYERVIEFLEVMQRLLPHLVSSLKHMKIVFGFKTLVIMWMIQKGHCSVRTMEKTTKFFPSQLTQYSRCSRRHMELMRRNSEDFKEFAVSLARDEDMRQAYIRNLMEEQYGEQYAQKLEERLDHYLQQLESALPQLTCLDKVLRRDWPMTEGEELLLDLLASSAHSLPVILEKLLQCALINHSSLSNTPSSACSQPSALGDLSPIISPIALVSPQLSALHGSHGHHGCAEDQSRRCAQTHLRCPQESEFDAASEIRPEEESEGFDSPLLLDEDNLSEENLAQGQGGGGGGGGGLKGARREEEEKEVKVDRRQEKRLEKMEGGGRGGEEEEGEGVATKDVEEVKRMLGGGRGEEEEGVATKEVEEVERILGGGRGREEEEEGSAKEVERMVECEGKVELMLESGDGPMCSTHHKWMKSILQECSEELLSQGGLASPTPPLQADTPSPLDQLRRRRPSQELTPTLASTPEEAAQRGGESRWRGGASPACVLRISAETQTLLIRSPLFQPLVLLTRVPPLHCRQSTGGAEASVSVSQSGEEEEEEEEEEESLSFDVNCLFSDYSESETDNSDSDYVP